MIDWIKHWLVSLTWRDALIGIGLFILTFFGSIGVSAYALVRLPANYFHSEHAREFWTDKPAHIRWAGLVVKNLIGLLMIIAGIIMSLPGVPGQGILTILLGLVMMDIPGKRPFESRIVRIPSVLNSINKLRARYGKPPMVVD